MHFHIYHIIILLVLLYVVCDILILRHFIKKRKTYKTGASEFFIVYLCISIFITFVDLVYPFIVNLYEPSGERLRFYFVLNGLLFLFHVPKLIYQILWSIEYLLRKIIRRGVITMPGLTLSSILFFLTAYGMIWEKTDFKVRQVNIYFKNLPPTFDGFKILQISDLHLGSFYDKYKVQQAVNKIKEQNADIVVFTGDLVNTSAYEALPYVTMFSEIKTGSGKYAILGNHDMNDFRRIYNFNSDESNTQNIIYICEAMGFKMLLDEHVILKRGEDSIMLAGVRNWGMPPFKQYGNLSKALKGAETATFKILLTHDPSQWDAEVLPESNVDLTLAGHTHGYQMGINSFGIRWSPIRMYREWIGLYRTGGRYLYVNPGFKVLLEWLSG